MTFSNKNKVADAKWKIKTFRQDKKHITDFMIEFKALAMKAEMDNLHAIFLLKKNVQVDIIKIILGYPPIVAPETFKEQKVAIISVGQGYESTESQQDYRTKIETTYRGREIFMNIGKSRDNFNKDRKLRYFNYNTYKYMAKEYQKPKRKREIRKCYKCHKVEHIVRDCKDRTEDEELEYTEGNRQ